MHARDPGPGDAIAPDEPRAYVLDVSVVDHDTSTLLSLASALHRRQVEVLDARLCPASGSDRRFLATVRTTPRQARTVAATLRNLVLVRDVAVAET